MVFIRETGSGSDRPADYHELVWKVVGAACSQHVATVAIDTAGTGYVVGDELTLTHAGALFDARFEVTSVGGSGEITGLRIVSSGAFSNRLASAAVAAGGSGYVVGDVLEVQGGTAREPAKVTVATLSGSYSVAPSSGAATVGVGPNGFAGNDACTINPTMTGLIGTSALSVTGGSGSSATVDITLAETGWSVDGRNTDDQSFNSVLNEKQVVLVGDATGRTNKPYVAFTTGTATSGLDTRYFVALHGMAAHNAALALTSAPALLGDPGTFSNGFPYLFTPQNQSQEIDLWLTIDDLRIGGVINTNPGAANTDDGSYLSFYAGLLDSFATETEQPYPMLIHASSRVPNTAGLSTSANISGLPEVAANTGASTGTYYWSDEESAWRNVFNHRLDTTSLVGQETVLAPTGLLDQLQSVSSVDQIIGNGPLIFASDIARVARQSPTRRLLPVPGSTPALYPIPLTLLERQGGTSVDPDLDRPIGQLRGMFFVFNSTDAAATIANFAEDYLTIGSDRYRVFHNHRNTALYQFFCVLEDV